MTRPLAYRHTTFDMRAANEDVILAFTNRLAGADGPDPARASRIHTFWLDDSQANSNARVLEQSVTGFGIQSAREFSPSFWAAWTALLPLLTSMQELCIRAVLPVPVLKQVGRCNGSVIRKMDVLVQEMDLVQLVPCFSRFPALEELCLDVSYNRNITIPASLRTQGLGLHFDLPSLISLETRASSPDGMVLVWLSQSALPNLTTLRLHLNDWFIRDVLSIVMKAHGAKLTTFGYSWANIDTTTSVFPYTPHLISLGIPSALPQHRIVEQLRGLPPTVTKVVLYNRDVIHNHQFEFIELIPQMCTALQDLFHARRALPTFHMTNPPPKYASRKPFLWRTQMEYELDRHSPEYWNEFLEAANRLLGLGVVVVDEEGVELRDVVREREGMRGRMLEGTKVL